MLEKYFCVIDELESLTSDLITHQLLILQKIRLLFNQLCIIYTNSSFKLQEQILIPFQLGAYI